MHGLVGLGACPGVEKVQIIGGNFDRAQCHFARSSIDTTNSLELNSAEGVFADPGDAYSASQLVDSNCPRVTRLREDKRVVLLYERQLFHITLCRGRAGHPWLQEQNGYAGRDGPVLHCMPFS
jgi:hypothetical protein